MRNFLKEPIWVILIVNRHGREETLQFFDVIDTEHISHLLELFVGLLVELQLSECRVSVLSENLLQEGLSLVVQRHR